ncbi:MAG: molybdenum cofactor guanylyltransferase MobA [Rubrivivax sp.]|nr:molybdenum cofactor guanylyltransferase MobA [Rubrivivax sp.]
MTPCPIPLDDITGIVLAGGKATRMGGVDKGLQTHRGVPLALYTLLRLQPQVGHLMVNANRNIPAYEALGTPVWPDSVDNFAGPLAGMLVGLERCETAWLVTVPCDTPNFPEDLVSRLAQAVVAENADIAIAATRADAAPEGGTLEDGIQPQPVFALMRATLLESLSAYLDAGQRKIDRWTAQQRCATVVFDDASAFFNANTREELLRLQG